MLETCSEPRAIPHSAQVRKICCACLVKLYRLGDSLPLYARISSLQGFLSTKEALARTVSELSRIGALDALASLSLTFGGQLGSSMPESVSIAAKHCYRCMFPEVTATISAC